VLWGADLYLRRASAAKRAYFVQAVRAGGLALNGMYANELTGLCRPEELLQLFRYGTELGAQCGVKVDSAMLSDVPGCTWGTVTAMAQAGIRYFSPAPNWFDRIGTLMAEWQDKPFWWVSPSGKEKILLWIPFTGYAMSHVVKKMSPGWVGDYQDRLDEVRFPYEISYIRWSGHGDNAEPDPEISEFIKSWGTKYAWPKFQIASTSTAFSTFEKRYGGALPEYRKDLTPYWEDGAGSSAFETALNRSAADRLLQAEALFAMSEDQNVPREQVRETWRNVLLYSEHTWGAFNSVSDSENKFVTDQWKVKRDFALNADRESRELLTRALTNNGQSAASGLDIRNTTSWTRSDLIVLSKELSAAGDRVEGKDGKAVASQRLITGELAIALKDVPAFASTRLTLQADKAHFEGTPVTIDEGVLDNGLLRVRVHLQTGNIVELHSSTLAADNLADTSGGEALNEFLFVPGSNLADLQRSGPATVTIEEHGPLVASLRIESSAPACKRLTRRVKLIAGADYVEISNLVDKERAPLNPNPGKDGPGGAFAQNGNKESIQFAFPFKVPEGQIRVNAPLATMRPEADQLPGSCKNWVPVGRWIDVSNEQFGVTLVSLDAPLVEIGEISANLLGSQRNPAAWRTHILPAQRFYSWVMNNHWGTNYRAYQEGAVEFRYAVRPHKRYDPAAASRFAIGLSQPLLAAPGGKSNSMPFLTVEPDDVLVTALKLSDDGKAFIVRLFGASGQDRLAKLTWSGSKPKALWRSDLSETPLSTIQDKISVSAWDLVTIRAEHS
jgi:alpha-mannosidase